MTFIKERKVFWGIYHISLFIENGNWEQCIMKIAKVRVKMVLQYNSCTQHYLKEGKPSRCQQVYIKKNVESKAKVRFCLVLGVFTYESL